MESIREVFDTKVCDRCDVLVAGGGKSGGKVYRCQTHEHTGVAKLVKEEWGSDLT